MCTADLNIDTYNFADQGTQTSQQASAKLALGQQLWILITENSPNLSSSKRTEKWDLDKGRKLWHVAEGREGKTGFLSI